MFAPPLALVFGIIGVIKDASKKYAVAGLVISGLTCLLWLVPVLFMTVPRLLN